MVIYGKTALKHLVMMETLTDAYAALVNSFLHDVCMEL